MMMMGANELVVTAIEQTHRICGVFVHLFQTLRRINEIFFEIIRTLALWFVSIWLVGGVTIRSLKTKKKGILTKEKKN